MNKEINLTKVAEDVLGLSRMKTQWLKEDLEMVIRKTRKEPGLSLEEIASVLGQCFESSELKSLQGLIDKELVCPECGGYEGRHNNSCIKCQ